MDWKTKLFTGLLAVFTIWLGWKYFTRRPAQVVVIPTETVAPATPAPTQIPATKEDIAQLVAVPLTISGSTVSTASSNLKFAAENRIGIVTLFGENIASTAAQQVITQIKQTIGGDVLIAVDHEGGSVQRLSGKGFTKIPALQSLCAKLATERQTIFATSAAQLRTAGVDIVFAPVVDVASRSAVLRDRACSDNTKLVTFVAQEAIDAYISQGILPVIKHYPGIGSTTRDLHNEIDAVLSRPPELEIIKNLLTLRPQIGTMSTHVLVTGLSENAPCSLDVGCMAELASFSNRQLIFTDALEMKSARTGQDLTVSKPLVQVAREAILAGNHILVFGKGVTAAELDPVLKMLITEYDTNVEMRARIDTALERLKLAKQDVIQ